MHCSFDHFDSCHMRRSKQKNPSTATCMTKQHPFLPPPRGVATAVWLRPHPIVDRIDHPNAAFVVCGRVPRLPPHHLRPAILRAHVDDAFDACLAGCLALPVQLIDSHETLD